MLNRHTISLLLVSLLLLSTKAINDDPIRFSSGELEQAIRQGSKENKYIFVNTFSQSCNLCPSTNSQIFRDQHVSQLYNNNFVNFNLNFDHPRYSHLSHILDLGTHATMLFFNKQGLIMHRTVGISSSKALLHAGEFIIKNRQDTPLDYQNYDLMLRKYDLGYEEPSFLFELAKVAKRIEKSPTTFVNKYLSTQSPADLSNELNRKFIYAFTDNIDSDAINYFLKDIHHYKQVLNSEVINQKIKIAVYNGIRTAISLRDERLYQKALWVIDASDLSYKEDFRFHIIAEYAEGTLNWQLYHETVVNYIETYGKHNPQLLNEIARKYFYVFLPHKDIRKLRIAQQWAQQSVNINPAYDNYLTLAYLSRQVNKCDEAHQAAVKAIHIAQSQGIPFTDANKLREAIELRGCQ